MATLDSDDLNAIEALLAPIEAKIDTVISSLTSIAGIVTDNNDMLDALPTTGASGDGATSFVARDDSVAPWDALFDVADIAAHWDFADRGTCFRSSTAQGQVGDNCHAVVDRVNGWPAILNGVGAVAPVFAADGLLFGGSASAARLRVTDAAALDLLRDCPYAYFFCVASPATPSGTTQQFIRIATNDSTKSRASLYTNSSGRGNFDTIRLDADAQTGVFTANTGNADGTRKIWYGEARFADNARNVRVQNANDATANLAYSSGGNTSDTASTLFLLGGTGNTTVASGTINGKLHELLIVTPTAALTSGQINTIHTQLAAKWGVTL
jgi:hypothetical protein